MATEKSTEHKDKLPKGYILICIAFIFATVLELLITDCDSYQTINLGFSLYKHLLLEQLYAKPISIIYVSMDL